MTNQDSLQDVTDSSLRLGRVQVELLLYGDLRGHGAWLASLTGYARVGPGLYSCLCIVNYVSLSALSEFISFACIRWCLHVNCRIVTFFTTWNLTNKDLSYTWRAFYLSMFSSLDGLPFFKRVIFKLSNHHCFRIPATNMFKLVEILDFFFIIFNHNVFFLLMII